MKSLKQWKWAIDFSQSIGQIDADIPPILFFSREEARNFNKKTFPKGKVVAIKITKVSK